MFLSCYFVSQSMKIKTKYLFLTTNSSTNKSKSLIIAMTLLHMMSFNLLWLLLGIKIFTTLAISQKSKNDFITFEQIWWIVFIRLHLSLWLLLHSRLGSWPSDTLINYFHLFLNLSLVWDLLLRSFRILLDLFLFLKPTLLKSQLQFQKEELPNIFTL